MKKPLLFLAAMVVLTVHAQNPFAEYGYQPKIATFSNGQFNEFHDLDTIVQIGSVLFNTRSKQIIAFVEKDTLNPESTLEPDIVSRWLSPDPLAAKYPSHSPYVFTLDNPILFVDPDGRDNHIYLVVLPGTFTHLDMCDVEKIVDQTNARFEEMGLDTRVSVFMGNEQLDRGKLDLTDSYVLLGNVEEVLDYAAASGEGHSMVAYSDWQGGKNNPENSMVGKPPFDENGRANLILLDSEGLSKMAKDMRSSVEDAGALLITHGAGHNAGIDNAHLRSGLMQIGTYAFPEAAQHGVISLFDLEDSRNQFYVEQMKKRFQNGDSERPSKANYYEKQANDEK